MNEKDFRNLSAKAISQLFSHPVPYEYIRWGQSDHRKSVQLLVDSYIKRQAKIEREEVRLKEMYYYERRFYEQNVFAVAGVDEVGRGPIAGPITVAAVILPPFAKIHGLDDSKKMNSHKRESLFKIIMDEAISVSCISLSPAVIDELNIYKATQKAMYDAIQSLACKTKVEAVLVDTMPLKELSIPHESIIKGDSKSASIAAASIVAKVTRDRYMTEMDKEYPGFGFAIHKGYYTKMHKEAIASLGVTPIHRKSFEPIKSIVF